METVPPGIATFVSVRLSGPVGKSVTDALVRAAKRESGRTLAPREDLAFTASFPLISDALAFTRRVHEIIAKDPIASPLGIAPAIGIECGEVHPGANLKRLVALERCSDLAELAFDGQNLVGPVARELARPTLPAGFGLIHLGEMRLGSDITADRISQLTISGFKIDFPRIEALDQVASNIPEPPADFIGRDQESKEIRRALTQSRLVTVHGAPGVGKSSIAHWLAHDLVDSYRDGAWKVDLARIPRGGSVATAIAADLKLPAMPNHSNEDRIRIALSTMIGLIWIDNCEHVIEQARELLPNILKYCGGVTLLITSRMPLRVEDELQIELETFSVPTDPDDYADSEAVRLFVNRARQTDPDFQPDPSELETIAEICRRVDGLPLAIELAAAQIGRQPLETLLARLIESLKRASVKTTSRHKTLDGALSWSYSLLSPKEQRFFRSLGPLAGPTDKDLVIGTGSTGPRGRDAAEEALQALVSASLVKESKSGARRAYRLLEPTRQFALDQLRRSDEERAAWNKFAKACLTWLLELKEAHLPPKKWEARIHGERANLQAALQWLLDDPRGGPNALRMCVELYDYWILQGPYDQAHKWFEQALEHGKSLGDVDTADIHNWIGVLAGYAGRYSECKKSLMKSIQLHRKSGKKDREAAALTNLGMHMRNCGELEESIPIYEQALSLAEPGSALMMRITTNIASHLEQLDRLEEARTYHREALALNERFDNPWVRANLESQAASFDLHENNTDSAEKNVAKCLASYREVGNMQGLLGTIEFAGFLALRVGNLDRAARLIAGAQKLFLIHGVGRPPVDEKKKDDALSEIEKVLGQERAQNLYLEGALMSIDELYDFARSGVGAFRNLIDE